MEDSTVFVLAAFNRLHKKMNVLYHDYAKSAGLSEMAFDSRILCYTICDSLSGGVMDGFLFRNPNSCFKSINRYEKRVFVIALTLCQNKIIKGNICRINET